LPLQLTGLNNGMAELLTAFAAIAGIFGGLIAWVLSNERRIATLEKGQCDLETNNTRLDKSITSAHERLDGWMEGRGGRSSR
jgi:hypothetical protein